MLFRSAYAALFFDVRPVLGAKYYITIQVIGLSPARDFTEKDVEVWLKFFAYSGGPHALDTVLDFYRSPETIPNDITQVEPARRTRVRQQLTIRAAILMNCIRDGNARMLSVQSLIGRQETDRRDGGLAGDFGDALPPVRLRLDMLEGAWSTAGVGKAVAGRAAG